MIPNFDYDYIRDYQQPKIGVKIVNAFGGIGLLIYGIRQILDYLKQSDALILFVGLISIMGGLSFLLFAINGNKPWMKQGECYFKIKNNHIYLKLGKLSTKRVFNFDEIDRIDISNKEIILTLKNRKEVWIGMNKFQNEIKRKALIEILKNWQ